MTRVGLASIGRSRGDGAGGWCRPKTLRSLEHYVAKVDGEPRRSAEGGVSYEVYLNDPGSVATNALRTELFAPLAI